MTVCNEGIHEDYIYGFLFHSKNKRIVLDDGDQEYPIDTAEVLLEKICFCRRIKGT
ncbi:hypothetical protein IG1_05887 [Bacillus cereus HD73]|nr:hypothetical protein IG1_05887 [Bacillus cereus HD73]